MTFTPFSLPADPNSQILLDSTLSTQVQGASTPAAVVDPQDRPGWYYDSTLQTNSFVWTIFNGAGQNYTLGSVNNLTFTATHDNLPTNKCYIAISSATSKIVYENNNVDLIPGEKCLFYNNTIPSNPNNLRLVKLNLVTNTGPCLPGEALTSITLEGTNAILFPNSLQICVENISYLFSGETVPVVVNLYTISSDVDALNATLQITNGDLTALNTTLGTNNTALGTNSTALGTSTTALGTNNTNLVNNTAALGTNSTALGLNTTALGTNTTASGVNTTALGTLNTTLQSGVITTSLPAINYDAFGRLRVSNPFTLFDSSFRYGDNSLWASSTLNDGTVNPITNQGLVELTVTSIENSQVVRETYRVFSYQPGKSLLVFNSFVGTTVAGVQQRIGYFGAQNGIYFQINGDGTCSFVKRSYTTGYVLNTPVLQGAWNGDKLNGSGPSGYTLNLTKPQLMWLDFEWLGVGTVRCGFVINEKFILCHSFNWANDPASSPTTYITTASLPLRHEIINNGGGGGTLRQICSTVISEGGYELSGTQLSIATPLTSIIATGTTPVPVISLRLNVGKLDAIVIITAMNIIPSGPVSTTYFWQIIRSGTTTGGSWIPATGGSVDYNLFSSGGTITGGICMASGFFSNTNQSKGGVELLKESLFRFQLLRNGLTNVPIEFAIVCSSIATTNASVFASIDWEEVTR